MKISSSIITGLLATLTLVGAQTSTSCNPTNITCPADKGLNQKTFNTDFTKSQNSSWSATAYTTLTYSDLGAGFTVKTKNDAPTISTDFYIFFGYIEVKMRAAPGTGIVSSIVLESDDLDEVDWELLGGYPNAVQTNFFGKGNTTAYDRMASYSVTSATSTFHTYALNWTSSSLTWLIDGVAVRTLSYNDALALNGKNYPQTPSRLKLGAWAGGASDSEGTVAWAGGKTDFSQGPFTMYVDSVSVTNYNPASQYTYGDRSGDWTSIKIDGSNSTVGGSASGSSSSANSTSASGSATLKTSATVAPISSVVAATGMNTSSTRVPTSSATSSIPFMQSTGDASRPVVASVMGLRSVDLYLALWSVVLQVM